MDGKYEVPKEVSLKRNVSLKGLDPCGIPQIDKLVWTSPKLTGEEVMVPCEVYSWMYASYIIG